MKPDPGVRPTARDSSDTQTRLLTLGDSKLVPVPTVGLALSSGQAARLRLENELRTVVYLMLFRVALATLLLGAVLVVTVTGDQPESLSGPFGRYISGLLATTYMASVCYGLVLRRIRNPLRFAFFQIAIDLLVISALVHATGGAQSAYNFLYLIDVVAIALLPSRLGTVGVAVTAGVVMLAVFFAGYLELLPPVPGQTMFPWDLPARELWSRVVVNLASLVAVGALGFTLSSQTRQAGERLERHEQFAGDLASLHENTIRCLPSGLVTTTRTGIITSINEAACEIFGITESHGLRQPVADRIPGLAPMLQEAGPIGEVRRREVDAVRPDGTIRRLGISATPLTDHTGTAIGRVIHFQDLTELRRMEQAVQRSERLAGIGRLAAGIAHEIRNPLASISGSVETLKALRGNDEDSSKLAEIVVREVDRLNHLISSLLDYARPPASEMGVIDVSELAKESVVAFIQGSPRSQVSQSIDANLFAEGSDAALRRLLWNIMRNAEEAMPRARQDNNRIRVHLSDDQTSNGARQLVLTISDNGIGIPSENLDRLFEPFFTHGKASGTGLGLALVARIVEDHRGTIEVDSAPGQGTTFTIRLPAAVPNGSGSASAQSA